MGLAEALNLGFQMALDMPDVKYIARMDADDISLPYRISTQLLYLDLHPTIDLLGSSVFLFGERKDQKVIHYPGQHQLIKYNMLYFCSVAHPSLMLRASRVREEGVRYESGVKMEDYRLWLECIQSDKFIFSNIGSALTKLRKHDKNKSSTHTTEDESLFKLPYLLNLI